MHALFAELVQNPARVPDVAHRLETAPPTAPAALTDYDPHHEAVLAICGPYLTARGVGARSTTQAQLWHAFAQDPTPALFHHLRFSWQQGIETLMLYWPRLRTRFRDARERARALHKLLGVLRELDLDIPFPFDPTWDERELVAWKKQLRFPAHPHTATLDVPLFLRWAAYAGVREFWSAMDHCRAAPAHRVAILRHFPASRLLTFFLSVSGKRFDRLATVDEKMAVFTKICVEGKVDFDTWIRLDLPSHCHYDALVKHVCATLRDLATAMPCAVPLASPSTSSEWSHAITAARTAAETVVRAAALVETLGATPSPCPGADTLATPGALKSLEPLLHRTRILCTALGCAPLPDAATLCAQHAAAHTRDERNDANQNSTARRHRTRGYYANRPSPFLRFFVEHVVLHHLPERVHDALEATVALLEQLTEWHYAPEHNPAIVQTLRAHEAVAKGWTASREGSMTNP